MTRPWMTRTQAVVLIAAAAAGALSLWFRFAVVESHGVGQLCVSAAPPDWCEIRQAAIATFLANGFGAASLAGGMASVLLRSAWLTGAALAVGLAGLALYNGALAGPGTALAFIALARLAGGPGCAAPALAPPAPAARP